MSYSVGTSLNQSRATLEQRIKDTWTALGRDTAFIQWPNTDFNMPKRGVWLRVTFHWLPSTVATIVDSTQGLNQQHGMLILTVFGPRAQGAGQLLSVCDAFNAAFERQTLDEVMIDTVDGPIESGDEAWAAYQVTYDFYFYRCVFS